MMKSFQINKCMDFRNARSKNYKKYDFSSKPEVTVANDAWIKYRIERISEETHNTKRFTLALPGGIDERMNLPIVSSFRFKGYDLSNNNAEVIKKYTPVSDSLYDGHIDFVIKYYPNGKMTPYLFTLSENDYVEMNGPIANGLQYPFSDNVSIGMIAGGTGITPMINVLKEMCLNTEYDTRFVDLMFANQTYGMDYLCQSDLMSAKAIMDKRLNIFDFFEYNKHNRKTFLPNSWNNNPGRLGRIDLESMQEILPKPSDDTLIMLCGPPAMKEQMYGKKTDDGRMLDGYLAKLGYTAEMIHVF